MAAAPDLPDDRTRTVGIAGGTGPMGRGLALRLAAAGHRVLLGSREQQRAAATVEELVGAWPEHDLDLRGVDNDEVVTADVVLLTAPWQGTLALAEQHEPELRAATVVSVANALAREAGSFLPLTMPRGSVTAEVQALLPHSDVVGAFHHLPASRLTDLDVELEADVLVVADDEAARTRVRTLASSIDGVRGIDAGGLAAAGAIEAMTAVLVQVNVSYRTHSMLRLAGALDDDRLG